MTAPDQLRPTRRRPWQIAGVLSALVIVLMAVFGNHQGRVENYVSYVIAGLMLLGIVVEEGLRRSGLRS
ncbi:DUF2631 domain-containing protein [Pilimelia anulata]|uniref:DUF2631 domain-containing protein n=1 Tax=Pilimelia anulata TaxID=53371 RepID=UPI001E3208BA|nr:DUF2631 domain-containing protein [Pilimelia anulata]